MKKLFFAASLVLSINLFAQKQFEGVIYYNIQSFENREDDNESKKEPSKLIIYFMPNRMKIVADEKDEVLVFLDSAKVYILDNGDKEYRIKKMIKRKAVVAGAKEVIAGFAASPARQTGSRLSAFGSNVQLWLADELFFTVPAELADNEEILMVHENKIMLKAEIGIPYYEVMEDDTTGENASKILATIKATEVKPGPVDASIFTIPADYKEEANNWAADSVVAAVDTAMWVPDTIAVKTTNPEQTPIKKKTTPAPVKTKTAPKQPARKP